MQKDLFARLEDLRGKTICGIYKLQVFNHIYIGSSVNIKKRLRRHRTLLRNNKHENNFLQNAYNKYKSIDYEILETVDLKMDFLKIRQLESEYIKKYN